MSDQTLTRSRFLLDPWSADFAASVQADTCTVETPAWGPLRGGNPPSSAWFVDGVRRLDARLVGFRGEDIVHGLFATFAVGAVAIFAGRATFAQSVAERRLILTAGVAHSERLRVGNADPFASFPRSR